MLHTQAFRNLERGPGKMQGGFASRLARNLDIAPAHTVAPARSQRLHRCFLSCKSRGVALELVFVALAIRYFGGREEPFEKRCTMAPDGGFDPVDFGDV